MEAEVEAEAGGGGVTGDAHVGGGSAVWTPCFRRRRGRLPRSALRGGRATRCGKRSLSARLLRYPDAPMIDEPTLSLPGGGAPVGASASAALPRERGEPSDSAFSADVRTRSQAPDPVQRRTQRLAGEARGQPLTLESHAALCAEAAVGSDASFARALLRYGIADREAWRQLDQGWQHRLSREPILTLRWMEPPIADGCGRRPCALDPARRCKRGSRPRSISEGQSRQASCSLCSFRSHERRIDRPDSALSGVVPSRPLGATRSLRRERVRGDGARPASRTAQAPSSMGEGNRRRSDARGSRGSRALVVRELCRVSC
jgi:hypothetical protein